MRHAMGMRVAVVRQPVHCQPEEEKEHVYTPLPRTCGIAICIPIPLSSHHIHIHSFMLKQGQSRGLPPFLFFATKCPSLMAY